jgi:hypothetical protein
MKRGDQMASMKLGNILTLIVIASVALAALGLALGQIQLSKEEYQSNIKYQFSRIPLRYDYSCGENVFGLFITLQNNGKKTVQNLQVSVTNELCVGSIPPLPNILNPGQSIQFYVYTTVANGTVSVSGNNTDLFIQF